jgi:ribosomal protein S12 methylthiotransferase accessory factor
MARLAATYLNERVELLDGVYGPERQAELDAVSRLYNRLIGPVTSLILFRPEILDLPFYSSSCHHSSVGSLLRDLTMRVGGVDALVFTGGGKGSDMASCVLGALGEVAERLLGALHSQALGDRVVYGSYAELVQRGHNPLPPNELPLFSEEQYECAQFPYERFGPDTVVGWVEGRNLLTEETVLVPAQLVLVCRGLRASETRIGYSTSGGLAFHTDRRRALLHSLYEVIERDAINVRWYCRLAPPAVDVDLAHLLTRNFEVRQGRLSTPSIDRLRIYLNTLDVPIPVLTAVAIDASRR